MNEIIEKIKQSGLKGRGGANFPVGIKWEIFNATLANKKYVIMNAAEGEPDVFKDRYILENHLEETLKGFKLALDLFKNTQGYIFLNKSLYDLLENKIRKFVNKWPVNLVKEKGGYLNGEETVLIESIEGHRLEPRIKPPYPPEKGLWQFPTLINNVETFYHVYQISQNQYHQTRFYSLTGDLNNIGVYELKEDLNILEILKQTKNLPEKPFFVQVGGGASGIFLEQENLDQPISGAGSLIVYDTNKTDKIKVLKKILSFFLKENCGQCVPCREGIYRLNELILKKSIDWLKAKELCQTLKESSFCGLGVGCGMACESLIDIIVKFNQANG